MRRVVVTLFAALLSLGVIAVSPALAEEAAVVKPSKESLLAAWEKVQKENPYTVTFEKTKEEGVYNFETTIFPYKGKIKVLNLLIDKKPARYYDDYRDYGFDDPEEDYKGIVELELEGVDEKFRGKFSYSYETWDRDNALHYNAKSSAWYTPVQWAEYREALKASNSSEGGGDGKVSGKKNVWFASIIRWWPFMGVVCVLLVVAFWMGVRQQKITKELQDDYLNEVRAINAENQEINKGIVQRGIEGLAVQKEILETLKRKG